VSVGGWRLLFHRWNAPSISVLHLMWWFGVVLPSVFRFYASFQLRLCVLISIRHSGAAMIFTDASESKETSNYYKEKSYLLLKKHHTQANFFFNQRKIH
jgi:hypothetical protein